MPLKEAVLSFEWDFEPVSNHRTRITQRIVLLGDNAAEYVDQVRAGFGSTLVDGMRRIAEALERAERSMPRRDDRWGPAPKTQTSITDAERVARGKVTF